MYKNNFYFQFSFEPQQVQIMYGDGIPKKKKVLYIISIIFFHLFALILKTFTLGINKINKIIDLHPEFRKCWDVFFYLNKMKTKIISNHMSQYFIPIEHK